MLGKTCEGATRRTSTIGKEQPVPCEKRGRAIDHEGCRPVDDNRCAQEHKSVLRSTGRVGTIQIHGKCTTYIKSLQDLVASGCGGARVETSTCRQAQAFRTTVTDRNAGKTPREVIHRRSYVGGARHDSASHDRVTERDAFHIAIESDINCTNRSESTGNAHMGIDSQDASHVHGTGTTVGEGHVVSKDNHVGGAQEAAVACEGQLAQRGDTAHVTLKLYEHISKEVKCTSRTVNRVEEMDRVVTAQLRVLQNRHRA